MSDKQQLITVCALIHKKVDGVNKIFLAKRAETKQFLPGVFELPGGHVEFDEALTDALKREIMEEFDAEIVVGDPFSAFTYTNNVKQSHSVEIVYFAQFVDESQINLKPEDHSESVWVSEQDIQKAYTATKGQDDKEFVIARRGLGILNGQPLRFS